MSADLFSLEGTTALVTGGGRGIGFMIARGLLDAGSEVHIVSRDEAACQQAADELSDHGGVTAWGADLSTHQNIQDFASALRSQLENGLNILVNNSGAAWAAPVDEFPEVGWDKVVDLNLKAPFFLTQALLPPLEAAATAENPARVINIGSIDGLRVPLMESFSYSASKAGVHQLTKMLAVDLGPRHITVNSIAPGPFATKMMKHTLSEADGEFERIAPLRRLGQADDAAGVAVMLSSRAGAYMTGAVIPLDGGLSLVSAR